MNENAPQPGVLRDSAVIVAAIGLVAVLIPIAWNGCTEQSRQEREFQSEMILSGLESRDRGEIVRYFEMIRDLGLLEDPELAERVAALAADSLRIPVLSGAPPVAVDDTVQTRPGQAVTVAVLRNDIGSGLTLESYTISTVNGSTVVKTTNEELRYTPAPGFVGTETLSYVAEGTGGAESNSATVNVTVR